MPKFAAISLLQHERIFIFSTRNYILSDVKQGL